MSGKVHAHVIPVHFGDVDSAGILYFPRIFHFCHVAMEGFFADAFGTHYSDVLGKRRVGFPTVRTAAEYHQPIPYGVDLRMEVSVRRIGNSSVDLRFRAFGEGEDDVRQEVKSTVVCVDMDRFESIPIPNDIRRCFEDHLEPSAD